MSNKIWSLILFSISEKSSFIIGGAINLNDLFWFYRTNAREFLIFASREIITRSLKGCVEHANYLCHIYYSHNIGYIVITDRDYPIRAASLLLRETASNISSLSIPTSETWSESINNVCEDLISLYQRPETLDSVLRIERMKKDVDETKDILISSLDKLLDRGENLHRLVEKSDDLSLASKQFYDSTTRLNRCCQIL